MAARSVLSLSMSYRTVSSRRDAIELADPTKKGTLVSPVELADRLGNEADVYVLANPAVAFDFDDVMPR